MNSIKEDVLQALENDHEIGFEIITDKYFQEGKCPACGHRELWASKDIPWILFCGRINNCGERISVRDRYADLFSNWSERHPATDDDPHATARAYLSGDRRLSSVLTAGSYTQEHMRLKDGSTATCIRFQITPDCYWKRLLDNKAIQRNGGKKAKIVGDYKGKGWHLKKQVINEGDWVWITESIFKSIALCQLTFNKEPIKSITGLSANNLPIEMIKANKGKNITWVIALDNDNAGITCASRYSKIIEKMGETCMVAFPVSKKRDWDDEMRLDNLDDEYFKDSLWRGKYLMAETAKEKAFWLYIRQGTNYMVLEFGNRLWRSVLRDKKDTNAMAQFNDTYHTNKEPLYTDPKHNLNMAMSEFTSAFSTLSISNCLPKFLYAEINSQTEEKHYFFKISFPNRKNPALAGLSANDLDCPSNFKRSLLSKVTGARFKGVQADIDILHEKWFDHDNGPSEIRTIPFIGYDKKTGIYAFPEFGYFKGKMMKKNQEGYLPFEPVSIKSGLKQLEESVYHVGKNAFDPSWYKDFYYAFKNAGLASLAFWTGSLFAHQIRMKQQGYTFLELSGDRETGKTSMTVFLWRLLGLEHYEGVDPNKLNEKALSRKYTQLSNLPFVLIEADHGNFDYDSLKTMWEGGIGRGTGLRNHGLEINEEPFKGSLMVVQNLTVDGQDATLSRFFHIHNKCTGLNPEINQRLKKLKDIDIEESASYRNAVLTKETLLLDEYFKQYDIAYNKLADLSQKQEIKFTSRVIQCHAQIQAWAHTLPLLFGEQITKQQLDEFDIFVWQRCQDRQHRLQTEHELIQQFWELYEVYNWQEIWVKGEPIMVEKLNHLTGTGQIAINLTEIEKACYPQRLDRVQLKKLIPNSHKYRFIENKVVRSRLKSMNGRTRSCWIFQESV